MQISGQQKNQCPHLSLNQHQEKSLLKLARINKSVPSLFHLINCSHCQKKISRRFLSQLNQFKKINIIIDLISQQQRQHLNTSLRKHHIKHLFIKDFFLYSKMQYHQQYRWSTDLDILIKPQDLNKITTILKKQNYRIVKKLNYQVTFCHQNLPIEIDVHHLACAPHKNEFSFFNQETITQFSQDFISSARLTHLYYQASNEYWLLYLIIHFWGNDVLKRLRTLYDIVQFAHLYQKQINWSKFIQLAKKYQQYNFALFTLLLGQKIFNISLPNQLLKLSPIPFRVKLPLNYYTAEKIAIFPKLETSNQTKSGKNMLKEYIFLQLVVNETIAFFRLIRPQIIAFANKIIFASQSNNTDHI